MGSFYGNLTLLDVADTTTVGQAIGLRAALFGRGGDADTLVFPAEEDHPGLGRKLSEALAARVVFASVHDDDILTVAAWDKGSIIYEVAVPDPAEYFGMSPEDMGISAEDLAALGFDTESPGHDSAALVAALGRGNAAKLDEALAGSFVFATERHRAVVEALGLPTAAVGWGYRYLRTGGDDYAGGPLTELPRAQR